MIKLTRLEEAIYNKGERLILGVTHNLKEDIRHVSSYIFFRKVIENDLLIIQKRSNPFKIIDLGCSVGHGCYILSKVQSANIVGIDNSQESLVYAHLHYMKKNITYFLANLEEFIPSMPEYDYIVSRNVFEHIPNGLQLAFSTKWRYRLLFDVPYNEADGSNPHHVFNGIREEAFSRFPSVEIFFQDLSGVIYDMKHKPLKPNLIICIYSKPDLPKISDSMIKYPIPACDIKQINHYRASSDVSQGFKINIPIKLAVLSHVLPPSPSGQSVVLHRLFRDFKPDNYCLLSKTNYDEAAWLRKLPARYYHLPPEFQLRRIKKFGLRIPSKVVNVLLQVFQRAVNIIRIMKQEKCDAILACSGDIFDLPAGYFASRWARVPFYVYIFDYYSEQWKVLPQRLRRFFVRFIEPIVLRGAAGIIVPNEFLQEEYHRRYRVNSNVIHNPKEDSEYHGKEYNPWPMDKSEIKIVYTGAVYHANHDAFKNLIVALQKLDRNDLKLHLYTAQLPTELEKEGIKGPIVYHNYLSLSQILEVQLKADILFLPLAFDSKIPEVIKTSAPGKMGEFLASGRPILVYAPGDSYVSWYFKEYKCGVVVDQSEPAMLVQAIGHILNDVELRRNLVKNAYARAQSDFSLETARKQFLKLLQPKDAEKD